MEEYRQDENVSIKMNMKSNQKGLSLLEVVVVIAIMSVLVGVLTPHFLKYIGDNKTKECVVDREGILAIYERCIYEETLELKQSTLEGLLNMDSSAGVSQMVINEVSSFYSNPTEKKCPQGGTYTATVDETKQIATITCSCGHHSPVSVDFSGIIGSELVEDTDEDIDEPSSVPPTVVPSSESSESTSSEPVTIPEPGDWPWPGDERWPAAGGEHIGNEILIKADFKVRNDRSGIPYIILEDMKIPYERAQYGPIAAGQDATGSSAVGKIIPLTGEVLEFDDIKVAEAYYGYIVNIGYGEKQVSYGDVVRKEGKLYLFIDTSANGWDTIPSQNKFFYEITDPENILRVSSK